MKPHDLVGLESGGGSHISQIAHSISGGNSPVIAPESAFLYGIHKEAQSRQMKHMTFPAWEMAILPPSSGKIFLLPSKKQN